MSLSLLGLVLLAAVCHAGWNLATRQQQGNLCVLWLGGGIATILFTPFAALRAWVGLDPWATTPAALTCMGLTGLIHAVYFVLLGRAYERGEISFVYPIARGSGIGLTAWLAFGLLGESLSGTGILGIAIVSSGVLLLAVPAWMRGRSHGLGLALAVGATIPLYSIVDKIGTHLVPPVIYIWAMSLITTLVLAPWMLRHGPAPVLAVWRRGWRAICGIGMGAMLTYLLILYAFSLGPVGYVVAARESSVVIGAAAGVLWLGEHLDRWKVAGVSAITLGLVCLRLA